MTDMNRLTYRTRESYAGKTPIYKDCAVKYAATDYDIQDVINRLADYEDTGLTPEKVHSMYGELDAMMRVLNSIGSYDRLRELAEADKKGRVVILPCKVGNTVYDVDFGRISSHFIRKIEWNKQGGFARCAFLLPFDDFGKTVFLTREEAEKALEAMKNV